MFGIFDRGMQEDSEGMPPSRQDDPRRDTRPLSNEELESLLDGEVEPLDLNASRTEIKPTTWHSTS